MNSTGSAAQGQGGVPAGRVMATSRLGHVGPGRVVRAATSSRPFKPTPAQAAEHAKLVALQMSLAAAPVGGHTTKASVKSPAGPATTAPSKAVSSTAFDVLKRSTIPSDCATDCTQSVVNSPDTASAGADIIETSNYDIADSTNGGKTWTYQDPYSLSSGFADDQSVVYQPNRDRFFYVVRDAAGLLLGETASKNPTSWCTYQFTPSNFGGGGVTLDEPKVSFSNNDLYITWNLYSSTAAWVNTGLARFSLDSLATCGGIGFSYFTRTDNFAFGLTGPTSSLDTFYWVSNWYTTTGGSGSELRIYWWAENSDGYSYVDLAINPYNFGVASCGSPDGTITNWCPSLDASYETPWISRAEYRAQANSAFAGDSILGVAIQAGPSSFDANNYIVYEYFKLNALTYIGNDQTYSTSYAFAYAGCGVNEEGYTGCIMTYGGGPSDDSPGTFLLLQDNVSPTQPWAYDYASKGAGNATDWGDFLVAQPYQPEIGAFIGTGWRVNGRGAVVPTVYIWGRGDDANGYNRWK
jgi:hypothetical protein